MLRFMRRERPSEIHASARMRNMWSSSTLSLVMSLTFLNRGAGINAIGRGIEGDAGGFEFRLVRDFGEHRLQHTQHLRLHAGFIGGPGDGVDGLRHANGHKREEGKGEDDFEKGETRRGRDCACVFHPRI
jgi:hypothetical protein